MSTKTILKKIAVVAVAALAIGGVSAVSANAVFPATPTITSINGINTPAKAQAGLASTLTIGGTNFLATGGTNVGTVEMKLKGGSWAAVPTSLGTTTSLTATVPASGATGDAEVRVTFTDGTTTSPTSANKKVTITPRGSAVVGACELGNAYDGATWNVAIPTFTSGANMGTTCPTLSTSNGVSVSGTTIQGVNNVIVFTALKDADSDSATDYSFVVTGPNSVLGATGSVISGSAVINDFTVSGNTVSLTSADRIINTDTITVSAANSGLVTAKWIAITRDANGIAGPARTVQTFNIVVGQNTSVLSYTVVNGTAGFGNNTKSAPQIVGDGDTDVDGNIYAPKGSVAAGPQRVASVYVHQVAPSGDDLSSDYTKAVTASLSGVGGINGSVMLSSANYYVVPANNGNATQIDIYNDGRSGVATVAIAVNGVTVKTVKVTFYGSPVAIKTEQNNTFIAAGGDGMEDAIWVWATDAAGVVVPNVSFSAVSSDSAVITNSTVDFQDNGTYFAYGAKAYNVTTSPVSTSGQKATVTYSFVNADGATVSAPAASFTLGGSIKTVTTTLDAPSYALGSPAVLTLKALDSAGNTPFDGQGVNGDLFVKCVTNASGSGTNYLCSNFGSFLNGSATIKTFAPVNYGDGTWTVDRTRSDYVTHVTASATLSADVTVSAAADAAAEATDAANAATDAANAAAEAADAATAAAQDAADAVAALAAQVSTMISALKKQLIALTNLVIKIQKKVRA